MLVPRQLVLAVQSPRPNTRAILRSHFTTRYLTSANNRHDIRAWRSRLPSRGCIYGNRHNITYISGTWDWANLLRAPAKEKSKQRQRRKWPKPKPKPEDVVEAVILMGILLYDYFCPLWSEYQVIDKEDYSTAISIVTVRPKQHNSWIFVDPAKVEPVWKVGIWTIQVSDYIKIFQRIFGNVSTYTPLPPLTGQDPGDLRLLIHRKEDDSTTTDAVHEKTSTRGAMIRVVQPYWSEYIAPIPENVQQVVVLANGGKGIAPMLQTIHTLQARSMRKRHGMSALASGDALAFDKNLSAILKFCCSSADDTSPSRPGIAC
jgi:NAD(P)H-flavin reductase